MRDCAHACAQQAVSAILKEGYPLVSKAGLHGMHGSWSPGDIKSSCMSSITSNRCL